MNKYELTVVVNAKIEDDVRVATVEKVKEYVARYGGTVTNVDEWGKKRLAYEIQKMKEGFYYFIQFEADATAPAEIERHVRIMENVIRYMIRSLRNLKSFLPVIRQGICRIHPVMGWSRWLIISMIIMIISDYC